MEKEFLNCIQSLALKELGFDEPCIAFYKDNFSLKAIDQHWGSSVSGISKSLGYRVDDIVLAPTFRQARLFFEKVLGFYYEVYPDDQQEVTKAKEWFYIIKRKTITTSDKSYKSREEAESACIDNLIELANANKT